MMSMQERQAWFILAVFAVALIAYFALVLFVGFRLWATAVLGLSGLAGLAPLIGGRERRDGKVLMDERDQAIAKSASLAGFAVFWVCFVAACMTPFFVKGPQGTITISVFVFPILAGVGMAVLWATRSLVIVVLYRRGRHGERE